MDRGADAPRQQRPLHHPSEGELSVAHLIERAACHVRIARPRVERVEVTAVRDRCVMARRTQPNAPDSSVVFPLKSVAGTCIACSIV
jgi:hypothetical protein